MKQPTVHHEQMEFLDKIEGQVRGIKKMVDDDRYNYPDSFCNRSALQSRG